MSPNVKHGQQICIEVPLWEILTLWRVQQWHPLAGAKHRRRAKDDTEKKRRKKNLRKGNKKKIKEKAKLRKGKRRKEKEKKCRPTPFFSKAEREQ